MESRKDVSGRVKRLKNEECKPPDTPDICMPPDNSDECMPPNDEDICAPPENEECVPPDAIDICEPDDDKCMPPDDEDVERLADNDECMPPDTPDICEPPDIDECMPPHDEDICTLPDNDVCVPPGEEDVHLGRIRTSLMSNYPNPFNQETWIPYRLSEPANVTIRIYNTKRQLVRTLALGKKEAGAYLKRNEAAYWDGRNEAGEEVGSGVYFYTMKAGSFVATKKMLLRK